MKVELGSPVVLWLDNGEIRSDLVHLPACEKHVRIGAYGGVNVYDLADVVERPGLRLWPTLCGLDGWIYVYGGVIRDACQPDGHSRFCPVCMALAAVAVPLSSRRHSRRGQARRTAARAGDRGADQAAA